MTAIDRIKAVADLEYATLAERRAAIHDARAQEVAEYIKDLTFPADVTIGNAVVRISSPRRRNGAISFFAVVRVDGKVIDRDDHVVVNPPLLYPDPNGDVERTDKFGNVSKFRIDPLYCAAHTALDVALARQ